MRTYTQISSGNQRSVSLIEVTKKLAQLDVHVTPAPSYDSSGSLWQTYSTELHFYKSIAKSSFHILYNNEELNNVILMQTLYALYKRRPIIMVGRPTYSDSLDPELERIFISHMRQFSPTNIFKLEFAELSFMLNKLKPEVDYRLTPEEATKIISKIRSYLYDMVGQGLGEINAPLK